MKEKPLRCRFNDETQILINSCLVPYPDIIVIYENITEAVTDFQIIQKADKRHVTVYSAEGHIVYEFYNMILGSTQILENGDGTITVHYYLRDSN